MDTASGLRLSRTTDRAAEVAALTEAVTAAGGARVGVDGLLDDLSRRLRRTLAPHPRLLGRHVARALTWEANDRADRNWWPQGITTAEHTGVAEQVLVTSWYAKDGQGVRLSFLDLRRRRYQHVLVVVPTLVDGRPGLAPLGVHAGGLVWHGRHLHVAATRRGFLTCDVADVLRVPDPTPYAVGGYRYVLPVRWTHRAGSEEGVEPLRYSFLSLDRSTTTPALVVGEYGSARRTRRLVRIPVDDASGELLTDADGIARPVLVEDDGPPRMQGAVVVDGRWYLTASQGHWTAGAVHAGRPGAFTDHWCATPMGPEDLVWSGHDDLLWSTTEHPHRRWVFAMRRTDFD
ncbi:hypothetical protein KUV85_00110 [Nocardioides panacisoli]|uniref:hypothetical protein n=1 Tax=Nocardioides panacisoli TaxID=627624 RepID=UPI001C6283EF|nr:hypothetical protein [Nocardioides panacisoli]QYJ04117.1 hypothetical protein KUV85_00110 [Nocardioides panacisoli]